MSKEIQSGYKIKTYEEKFIETQAQIGTEVTSNWTFYGQTPAEGLKRNYSQSDFDPSTRFYAFTQDEMVGFLTSRIEEEEDKKTAILAPPLAKKGHEDAQKSLIKHALSVLSEKGVKKVTANLGIDWGNYKDLLNQFDFQKQEVTSHLAKTPASSIKISKLLDPVDIIPYDKDRDSKDTMTMLIDSFNFSEEQAKTQVERFNNNEIPTLISLLVTRKDNRTIAACASYKFSGEKSAIISRMSVIAGTKNFMNLRSQFLKALIKDCTEKGYEEIAVSVETKEVSDFNEKFSKLGLKAEPIITRYMKEL
ncbi:MAG: hypothetical protein ACFFCQ_07880 [Promethearchaeota archaeon]